MELCITSASVVQMHIPIIPGNCFLERPLHQMQVLLQYDGGSIVIRLCTQTTACLYFLKAMVTEKDQGCSWQVTQRCDSLYLIGWLKILYLYYTIRKDYT